MRSPVVLASDAGRRLRLVAVALLVAGLLVLAMVEVNRLRSEGVFVVVLFLGPEHLAGWFGVGAIVSAAVAMFAATSLWSPAPYQARWVKAGVSSLAVLARTAAALAALGALAVAGLWLILSTIHTYRPLGIGGGAQWTVAEYDIGDPDSYYVSVLRGFPFACSAGGVKTASLPEHVKWNPFADPSTWKFARAGGETVVRYASGPDRPVDSLIRVGDGEVVGGCER